jgi:hypothetical protein
VSMRTAYSCFGVAALLFVAVAIVNARPTRQQIGTLNGTLLDPQGAALQNAEIQLRFNYVNNRMFWDGRSDTKIFKKPRKASQLIITDSAGQFSAQLPPGNWDVFAFHDGYAPTCTIVLIQADQPTQVELRSPGMAAMSME